MSEFLAGLIDQHVSVWSQTPLGNVHGSLGHGLEPFQLGVAHANTGGQDSAAGTEPIPPSAAGTLALGVAGTAYAGDPNAQFDLILTNLVIRQTIDVLRDKPVIMSAGSYLNAKHVPGTSQFVYTGFTDIGAAETLLEGVPPVTTSLAWDQFTFTGVQKGKLLAITDLASLFSPFDMYSTAAEKLSWNVLDTVEKEAVALLSGATVGVVVGITGTTATARIVSAVTALKVGDVPTFADGTYRALISPNDAAAIMLELGEIGWTETSKYAASDQLLNGEIGKFRGVRFIESNRITDGKTIIHGPDAWVWGDYQTIQSYRVAPGGDHADPLAQRGLLGWKGMWGMAIVAFQTGAHGPASNPKGYRFAQVDLTP
jgi:hypothetical protein